jgi:hypothetical protein
MRESDSLPAYVFPVLSLFLLSSVSSLFLVRPFLYLLFTRRTHPDTTPCRFAPPFLSKITRRVHPWLGL